MVYVDTSVLVALCVNEAKSAAVSKWYGATEAELASAFWCVTEFASALAIKQRTRQLDEAQAQSAWASFERLCAIDLVLLPVEGEHFHRAATLVHHASSGLRAGDSLHLAVALAHKVKVLATLDAVMASNAKRMKFKLVAL